MPMFSLNRRPAKVQTAILEIQGCQFALPSSFVAGLEAWSGGGLPVTSSSAATGYTSYERTLVPVFDLSVVLGLPEREIGSEQVAIIQTSQGFIAVQIDRFSISHSAPQTAKMLTAEDLLARIARKTPEGARFPGKWTQNAIDFCSLSLLPQNPFSPLRYFP